MGHIAAYLAIVSVLLHATMLVRHHGNALRHSVEQAFLSDVMAEICHGTDEASGPDNSLPRTSKSDCPVCTGAVGADAVLSSPPLSIAAPDRPSYRMQVVSDVIAEQLTRLRPPRAARL